MRCIPLLNSQICKTSSVAQKVSSPASAITAIADQMNHKKTFESFLGLGLSAKRCRARYLLAFIQVCVDFVKLLDIASLTLAPVRHDKNCA
jgi:formylmethanofuran dehydrogenase subunit B